MKLLACAGSSASSFDELYQLFLRADQSQPGAKEYQPAENHRETQQFLSEEPRTGPLNKVSLPVSWLTLQVWQRPWLCIDDDEGHRQDTITS